jgi:hypothetical protein
MSERVSVDGVADAIVRNLQEYTAEITEGIKKAEDITANECRENLMADSPVGESGKYAKGWEVTVAFENPMEKRTVIHNKEYRLTHLLENGHPIIRGGRTIGKAQAFPHIKKNEEKANADFEQRVEGVIKNGH